MSSSQHFSPHVVLFHLAAIVMIGLKFGSILAIASTWLATAIGTFLFEPTFTLTIDNLAKCHCLRLLDCVKYRFSARAEIALARGCCRFVF